jgi:uncharacterized protein involved in type VI secretion and phage assembly
MTVDAMPAVDSRIQGVVIGLVSDVDDPDGLGRVRVRFPWLDPDLVSGWAPIAAPLGGNDRGYYYLPEVDDEALVAFELGDIDHPFILGFLHNGVDKPPTSGIDKHVRRVKSVAGHLIDLDDRDGQEKVHVKTNGGNLLDLRDSDSTIEIATSGGQKITMKDSPAQVEIRTTAGTTITMGDAPSSVSVQTVSGVQVEVSDTGVTISATSVPITVNALSATINPEISLDVNSTLINLTGAMVNINAAMTEFSGIVQCQTLITESVVSASYTPGAGNIW